MSAHTPGPWSYAGQGILTNGEGDEINLGLAYEDTPDGRLIAAAPELAEWLSQGSGKHRSGCSGFPALSDEEAWADCDCGLAALLRKAGVLP